MNNRRLTTVQVFERIEQLISPTQNLLHGECSASLPIPFSQQFFQVFPRKILHYQVLPLSFYKVIHHMWQYSVAQPVQQPRLACKGLTELLLSEASLLHCHPAAKPLVLGQVDSPHAALLEQRQDAIAILQDSVRRKFDSFHRSAKVGVIFSMTS